MLYRNFGRKAYGFTLTEMLVVAVIILVLATLVYGAVARANSSAEVADCVSRLHQTGVALQVYKGDWKVYPYYSQLPGLGDKYNWADLWQHSDPGNSFFCTNETRAPRVPRILEDYSESVEVLHCPSQGASAWWNDTGPYHYNATSPFEGGYNSWRAICEVNREDYEREPLAACTRPPEVQYDRYSWRHGEKKSAAAGGINNHLFTTGAIKSFINPEEWIVEE